MNIEKIPQYELLKRERIEDIRSEGYLLRHKKSGARVLLLENEDENKVFNIAFRTLPTDSTGVAHIMEHSVLCGSRLFPAKDPFVELVKGSLNTFLNAMTYPDKTMYPVASCNDKDFCNLMHVYLDAVFYPNIYKKKEIFLQEGWSYQLENPEDEIVYNGVVYNEMKGAFSSPEDVLDREIMNSLFPDTTYGVESGGDPACIPDLKYEDYLAFHQKYYHPSNSYIYFYGNMDMEERLAWLDREYLSSFDAQPVESEIKLQPAFTEPKEVCRKYPITENDELEDNTYLSWNAVIGTSLDVELSNAFAVLEYALLSAPGAALKQALLDAGIGKDIMSSYDSGVYQPFFSIIAKNANGCDKERFVQVIRETLTDIAENGIDKKALLAGINTMEFKFREADYGAYPKGLMYGLDVFDSWLYDDNMPFDYLKQLDVYDRLKEYAQGEYFENLIRNYLLENTHVSVVIVEPERGLTAKNDQAVREKLQAYKASLSEEEITELIEATRKLRAFQETPSTAEELEKIPMLERSDIGKKAAPFINEEYSCDGTTVLHHDVFTNGIAYIDLLFEISHVENEEIGYLGILKSVLGMMDTEHYKYQDLNNEINMNTGGISAGISVFPILKERGKLRAFAGMRARVLYDKIPYAFEMIEEILLKTVLEDDKRLYEILARLKSRLSMQLNSAGHQAAACRALAYISQINAFNDTISGIAFYELVESLEQNFDAKKDALKEKLRSLCSRLFTKDTLFVSLTSDKEGLDLTQAALKGFVAHLPETAGEGHEICLKLEKKNEGFMTPSQVQYVARTGNFTKGGEYTGVLRILKVLMSYDYLWTNVRVKGGAYGCMSAFGRSGDSYFVSYRDPHLRVTNEVYEGVPAYLEQFDADEREMTKYIIGTVSDLDVPMNPAAQGSRSLNAYFSGITVEELQQERDEILNATPEQIRALAPLMRAILEDECICVIGNEEKIKEAKELFGTIRTLTGAGLEEDEEEEA